ncbi:MAG: oligosaccharide flippase family protein [Pleomorphochaeta sp.]
MNMLKLNRMKNNRKLSAIISYLTLFLSIVLGLLYTPWFVSILGDSNYGLYTLAYSTVNIVLIDFGISSAISRFLSNYYAKNEYKYANNFLGIVSKLYMIIAFIIGITLAILFFNIDTIYVSLTSNELSIFKNLFILIALFSIFSFPFLSLNGILLSNELFIFIKICNLIQKISSIIFAIIVLLLGYNVYAVVLINILIGFIMILIKLIYINLNTRVKINFKYRNSNLTKEIFSFSLWVTISQISLRCIFNITPTILGIVANTSAITIFGLASSLEGYVYSFSEAINGLYTTEIAKIYTKKNSSDLLTDLMIKIGRLQVYLIGLILIGYVIIGKTFIYLWLGEKYINVYYCSLFMIIPSILDLPQQIGRTSILIKGKVKYQAIIYIIMAIINIILTFQFVKIFGVIGAGLSISISYLFRTFCMNVLYYKIVNINLKYYFRETYKSWIYPCIFTLGIGKILNNLINYHSFPFFILKCAIIIIIYCILLWVYSFNEYEKNLIKGCFFKINPK